MQDEKNSPSSPEMRQKIIEGLSSNLEVLNRKYDACMQGLKGLDSDGLMEERGSPSMPNRLTGNWSDLWGKLELLLSLVPKETIGHVFKPILKSLEYLQKDHTKTSSKKQRYKDRLRKAIEENTSLKQRLGAMRRSLEAMEHEKLGSGDFQKKSAEIEALKSKLLHTNQKLMAAKRRMRVVSPIPIKNYSANASPVFMPGKLEKAQKEAQELAQKHDYIVHIAEVMYKQMTLTNEKAKELAQLTQQIPEGTLKKKVNKVKDEVKIAISHFERGNFQKLIMSTKSNDTHFSDLLLSKTQEIEHLRTELKMARLDTGNERKGKLQTRSMNNFYSKVDFSQNYLDRLAKKFNRQCQEKTDVIDLQLKDFEEKLLGLEASVHNKVEIMRSQVNNKTHTIHGLKASAKDYQNEISMNASKFKRIEEKYSAEINSKSHEIDKLSRENKELKLSKHEFEKKLRAKEEEITFSCEKIKNQSELIDDLNEKIAKSSDLIEELQESLNKSRITVQTLESKLKVIDQSSSDQLSYYKNSYEKASEELGKEKESLRRLQTELAKMQYEKTLHEEDRIREISVLSLKVKDFETSLSQKENDLQAALEGFNGQKNIIVELNKKISDHIKLIDSLTQEKEESERQVKNLAHLLQNTEKNSEELVESYKERSRNLKSDLEDAKEKHKHDLNLEKQRNQELEKNRLSLIKEKENLILQFDNDKDSLVNNIKILEDKINDIETENINKIDIIKQMNHEIDNLKSGNQDSVKKIMELQKELNNTEKAHREKVMAIEVMEQSVSDQVTYYKSECEKLNQKLENLEREKNQESSLNSDLTMKIQAVLQEKTEIKANLDIKIDKLNRELEDARNNESLKTAHLNQQIQTVLQEKEELKASLNHEIHKINKESESHRNKESLIIANLNQQIHTILQEKEELKTDLDQKIDRLNKESENDRNKESLKISNLNQQIHTILQEKEDLKAKLDKKKEGFNKKLELQNKNESSRIADLTEQNQAISREKATSESSLNEEINYLNTKIKESDSKIQSLLETVDKFTEIIDNRDRELVELKTEQSKTSEELKDLKLANKSLAKSSAQEINLYKDSLKNLQSKWNSIKDYCQSESIPFEESADCLIEILKSKESSLKSLEEHRNTLLSENSSLKESHKEKVNTEIEVLKSQLSNFQNSNTTMVSELSSLRTLCEKQETEIQGLNIEKQDLLDSLKDERENRKTPELHISMEKEINIQSPSRPLTFSTQPSLVISPFKTRQLEFTHFQVSVEPSDPYTTMIEKIRFAGELTVLQLELWNLMNSMIPKHSRKTSTMAQDQSLEEEIHLISECLNESLSQLQLRFDNTIRAEQASLSLDYANERLATENSSEIPSKHRTESQQIGLSEKQILDEQMIEYQRKEILALKEELKETSSLNVEHLKMMVIRLMQTIPVSRETDDSLKPIIAIMNFSNEQLKLINSIRNPAKKGIWSKISNII